MISCVSSESSSIRTSSFSSTCSTNSSGEEYPAASEQRFTRSKRGFFSLMFVEENITLHPRSRSDAEFSQQCHGQIRQLRIAHPALPIAQQNTRDKVGGYAVVA